MNKFNLSALPLLAACAAEQHVVEPHHNLSADICLSQAKTSENIGYVMKEKPELINDINEYGCIDIKLGAVSDFENTDFIYKYRGKYAYAEPERVYDYPTDAGREILARICDLPTDEIKDGKKFYFSATVENCDRSVAIGECVGSDDFICDNGFNNVLNPLPVHDYVFWEGQTDEEPSDEGPTEPEILPIKDIVR